MMRVEDVEKFPLLKQETEKETSQPCTRKPSRTLLSVVMTSCLFLQLVSTGTGYGLSVMYVEIIDVFMTSRSEAALVQSVYLGVMLSGGVFLVWLVTKIGPGACTVIGAVTACAGLVVSSLAVNVTMVIVFTGVVSGTGIGLVFLSTYVTVSLIFYKDAKVPLVFLTIGSSLGQSIFPYVYEGLISEYSWKGAFLLVGGISLNMAVCGVIIQNSKAYMKQTNIGPRERTRICNLSIFRDVVFMVILSCNFLMSLTGPIEAWFLVDIMVLRGYGRSDGSLFVSSAGFANCLGRIIGVILRHVCRMPTIYHWIYLCATIGVSHALILMLDDYWSVFGAILLYGVSLGMMQAQATTIVYEAVELERFPQAVALLNLSNGLSNFLGGLLGGAIRDVTGSYDLLFYIAISASLFVSITTAAMLGLLNYIGSQRFVLPYGICKRGDSQLLSVKYNGDSSASSAEKRPTTLHDYREQRI